MNQRTEVKYNSKGLAHTQYTPEFKGMVLRFVRKYGKKESRNGYSYSAICRLFKLNRKTLDRWLKEVSRNEIIEGVDLTSRFLSLLASNKLGRR